MNWSYAELMATPAPVVDEVVAWMIEQYEEEKREQARRRR